MTPILALIAAMATDRTTMSGVVGLLLILDGAILGTLHGSGFQPQADDFRPVSFVAGLALVMSGCLVVVQV